jgi:pantoate kinase
LDLIIQRRLASIQVASPVAVAKAFSPGHITGFFEIPNHGGAELLHKGSRGAGFSVDRGIVTSVQIYDSAESGFIISINGVRTANAEVSRWVAKQYERMSGRPFFAKVDHEIGIPVGFGLGSSGAAALSLSYALNEALGTGLSRGQAAQIAHVADISCKTGLGTVIAEYTGGFELRLREGAPEIGTVTKVELKEKYKAVILCISPISTKSFLSSRSEEINGLGGRFLSKLAGSADVAGFMKMSHEFADTLGLTSGRCRAPIEALNRRGIEASVAMFGETVFTLVTASEAEEARDILAGFDGELIVCNIDGNGARVL